MEKNKAQSGVHVQIKGEKSAYQITQQMNVLQNQINKKQADAANLQAKAKELIAAGRKPEAQRVVAELKNVREVIQVN